MPTSRKAERNKQYLQSITPLYYEYLDGVTGKLSSDGVTVLPNASQDLEPGLTWVRMDGSREGAAILNGKVNPYSPNIPVMTAINRRTGKRQVVDADWEEAVRIFGADAARQIVTPGPTVYASEALLIGKVEPAADLTVYVRRFIHHVTEFPGAYEDLSAIVSGMSTDSQLMVLIGVDETDDTVSVTEDSTERSLAYVYTQADADAIAVPSFVVPLAALVLRDDQTASADSFVPYVRWFDRRPFLNSSIHGATAIDVDTIDPSSAANAMTIHNSVTLTANSTQQVNGLISTAELLNGTFNNTNANGVRGSQGIVLINGTAGTVSNAASYNSSTTVNGGVTLTNLRHYRILDPTVSGGSVLTSQVGVGMQALTSATNNTYLLLGTLTIPTTGSYGIYSTTANPSSHLGALGLGGNFIPTHLLSLSGEAARTVGMERELSSNTAGNSLTVQSGGATSAATNKAAGALVLATGVNTGNATPALVQVQGGVRSPTSATSDNANVDRLIVGASKVLTDNSAITIVNATLAASTGIGGIIRYAIEVFDGTDIQVETGFAVYSGVNKAGAFTVAITEVNSQQSVSAGTLATTWAISGANPAAISVNANSSLTPSTGYPRITYSIENLTQQAVAIA